MKKIFRWYGEKKDNIIWQFSEQIPGLEGFSGANDIDGLWYSITRTCRQW